MRLAQRGDIDFGVRTTDQVDFDRGFVGEQLGDGVELFARGSRKLGGAGGERDMAEILAAADARMPGRAG